RPQKPQPKCVGVWRTRPPPRRSASPASHRRRAISPKSDSPARASRQLSRLDKKATVMPARRKLMLPFTHWPIEDLRRWEAAFQSGDLFDENGAGTPACCSYTSLAAAELWEVFGISVGQAPETPDFPTGRTDRSANGGRI